MNNKDTSHIDRKEIDMLDKKLMQTVLDLAKDFDVGENSTAEALYDGRLAAINLWCTPGDHPDGWEGIPITAGAFCKAAEFVGTLSWSWSDRINEFHLQTEPYALREHRHEREIANRPADLAWAQVKIEWLFRQAGLPTPTITIRESIREPVDAWLDAEYEDRHGCGMEC